MCGWIIIIRLIVVDQLTSSDPRSWKPDDSILALKSLNGMICMVEPSRIDPHHEKPLPAFEMHTTVCSMYVMGLFLYQRQLFLKNIDIFSALYPSAFSARFTERKPTHPVVKQEDKCKVFWGLKVQAPVDSWWEQQHPGMRMLQCLLVQWCSCVCQFKPLNILCGC